METHSFFMQSITGLISTSPFSPLLDVEESELRKYQEHGKIVVAGHELSGNDLKVMLPTVKWHQNRFPTLIFWF